MKFAYALIAAIAYADGHEGTEETAVDTGVDAGAGTDAGAGAEDTGVVDTWTSAVTWEPETGATWEKASNWSKKYSEGEATVTGIPTTLTAGPDATGENQLTIDMEGSWAITW